MNGNNPLSGWLSHIRGIRQNPQAFRQSVGGDPLKGLMSVFMPGMFQQQQQAPQATPPQPIMPQSFNNMRAMRPMAPPTGMNPLVQNNMAVPPRAPLPPITAPMQIPQFNQQSQQPMQSPMQQFSSRGMDFRNNLNQSIMNFLRR